MRLTHLIALLVAVPSTYTLYQKLNTTSPESEQLLSKLGALASLQTQANPQTDPEPAPAQPSSASDPIRELKPADWVRGLPVQAQTKYLEIRDSLRGDDRIHGLRFWMALWNKQLRDPYLTLLELDYIDLNIKNRSPVLYQQRVVKGQPGVVSPFVKLPGYFNTGPWKQEFQLRLSTLDSMENMLRVVRVRSASHPTLSKMMGEFTDKVAAERAQLADYKRYFDDGHFR